MYFLKNFILLLIFFNISTKSQKITLDKVSHFINSTRKKILIYFFYFYIFANKKIFFYNFKFNYNL